MEDENETTLQDIWEGVPRREPYEYKLSREEVIRWRIFAGCVYFFCIGLAVLAMVRTLSL